MNYFNTSHQIFHMSSIQFDRTFIFFFSLLAATPYQQPAALVPNLSMMPCCVSPLLCVPVAVVFLFVIICAHYIDIDIHFCAHGLQSLSKCSEINLYNLYSLLWKAANIYWFLAGAKRNKLIFWLGLFLPRLSSPGFLLCLLLTFHSLTYSQWESCQTEKLLPQTL